MFHNISRAISNKRQVFQGLYNVMKHEPTTMNNVSARHVSQNLPRLPVPSLQQTMDKFLRSVRPHLNDKEYETTEKTVQKFVADGGTGFILQKHLMEKAQDSENWLADWWLNAAYLDFRLPVVVYSSPGLIFPTVQFKDENERLLFTAKLISAGLGYKHLIDHNKMPVDMMGKEPLDMNQYKKILGTCRIPGVKRDGLEFNPTSKHIVVVHKNHYFKVDVYGSDNKELSVKQLMDQLEKVKEQSSSVAEPVGILSTDNRDNWGKSYQILIKDGTNKASVGEIQKSLFLVCLDQDMQKKKNENVLTLASRQLIHGGGSDVNSGNRWYDKTVQFVIGKDGINGLTYEHSPSEGQPIAVMTDFLVNYINNDTGKGVPDAQFSGAPRALKFNISGELKAEIEKSKKNLDKLAANLDIDSFTFKSYGKEFIKSQKLSPDSFLQIAMQYAFYRMYKIPGAHYESAATRKYLHGRTETIRSCSIESVAFAKAMLNPKVSDEDKVKALRTAVNGHKKYTIDAVNGFGVDRHLLGLKLMGLEKKIEISPLYSDPGYIKSGYFRISTSQVATKCDGLMCYGAAVPDGYGCCYNPRKNDMNFAVSAFVEHPDTRASKFREALEKSLHEMHDLLVKTQKSKL